jgi:DNA processing protein
MENLFKILPNKFPEKLLEIPQPPKHLYLRGEIPDWENTKFIAVIGSRKFSNYGENACKKIISELQGYNIAIISGLAIGIDSIAHRTALENNLQTIAIPGSGLNPKNIYPSINKNLSEDIIKNGGCLISEFEPDFKATPWSFPQRNRIMAGLADLILIIEAEEKSGTLITARMGIDYNKEIAVIPASIFTQNSKGSNNLLYQGATPITSGNDILELLNLPTKNNSGQRKLNLDDFSETEIKIIELLKEPISRDELIRQSKISAIEINSTISLLEIKEIIKESGGKIYLK